MCGIAGMAGGNDPEHTVRRMVSGLLHRGPDGEGVWTDKRRRFAVGHRRLAILDTSDAGYQPMSSRCGRYMLAYNGECYNFRDLRTNLEHAGTTFQSDSDSEVVVEWLAKNGLNGLADFNGMFALALWDRVDGTLLLARDPFGIKPLYYTELASSGLAFASEVRSLVLGFPQLKSVPRAAIAEYMAYGTVLEPNSILKGVRMLPAGSWMSMAVDTGQLTRGTFSNHTPSFDGTDVAPQDMHDAFIGAVHSHLASDVPVGAFLSGGIDSSAIVAAMTRKRGFDVKTLTVSFPDEPAWDESARARSWAKRCGSDHREIPMAAADILTALPRALDAQDQPTLDGVNTYIVSKAASEAGLTVVLSGLGGDELFGGYAPTRDVPRALRMRKRLSALSPLAAGAASRVTRKSSRRSAKVVDMLSSPATVRGLYLSRRRIHSPQQVRALCPSIYFDSRSDGLQLQSVDHLDPVDAISYLESACYMRNQLLRDSDVMGMACSIEIRVPFLEHRFAELAWRAGPSWRDGKRRFASSVSDLLPDDAATRKKQGFTLPFERWLLGPLKSEVDERFASTPDFIHRPRVLRMWHAYQQNPGRVGWTRPWAIYVLLRYLDSHGLSVE